MPWKSIMVVGFTSLHLVQSSFGFVSVGVHMMRNYMLGEHQPGCQIYLTRERQRLPGGLYPRC